MPKVPKVSFWRKKKKLVTIVGVVLLLALALGAGVLLRWVQQGGPSSGPSGGSQGVEGAQRLPDVVSDVQDLNSQGKTEEATRLAEENLKNTSTTDEVKYMLYIQQGNGKYNEGDAKSAIPFYEKALAQKETYEITQLLGAAYAETGDKPKAIEFYKKALGLVPADTPTADDEKESLKQLIISLGGQP